MEPKFKAIYLDKENDFYLRVLHVNPVEKLFFYCTVSHNGKILSFPDGETSYDYFESIYENLELKEKDPFFVDRPENQLSQAQKEHRNEAMFAINAVMEGEPDIFYRGKRFKKISKFLNQNKGYNKSKVYRDLGKYFASGRRENALVPSYENCGSPGVSKKLDGEKLGRATKKENIHEKNLNEEDLQNIKKAYEGNYETIQEAYDSMKVKYYFGKKKYPTYSQFSYRGPLVSDPEKVKIKRVGQTVYNKDVRVLTGDARGTFGPGSEFQVDNTKDNTHTRSIKFVHKYLGRCTLYLVADNATAAITGVSLTPDNASYYALILAIYNVGCDKYEFLKWLGLGEEYTKDDWPFNQQPHKYLADKGEAKGYMVESLPRNLDIEIDNCQTGRPERKPIVERSIKTLLHGIAKVLSDAGLVVNRESPRIAEDTRKQAVLSYKDILRLAVVEIIFYNNHHVIEGFPSTPEMDLEKVKLTPRGIWEFYVRLGLDSLRPFFDQKIFWTNILPQKHDVSYSRKGYSFKGIRWVPTTKEGEEIYNRMVLTKSAGSYASISYNPADTNETFLFYNKKFFPLQPRNGRIESNLFEFKARREIRKQTNSIDREDEQAAKMKKLRLQKKIVTSAKAEVKSKRGADKIVLTDVAENKADEVRYSRNEQKEFRASQVASQIDSQTPLESNLVKPKFSRLGLFKSLKNS